MTDTTPSTASQPIRLLQLYPRDMNIYGDWGNTLVLKKRLEWHGYDVNLLTYDPGDELPDEVDLITGGGGQDSGQERIKEDLLRIAPTLHRWADEGVPMLMICGLYQLFGHKFITTTGSEIPGIGILDATTRAGNGRLIGNITLQCPGFGMVVGYENHSGLTTLGPTSKPFGTVSMGDGNNGSDKTEGARTNNVIGTYLHGSILPKNPAVADWLIEKAVEHRMGPGSFTPKNLDDSWADHARQVAANRPR
ncbi:type 1 glutamine amidotransferase [Actinomyces vulturis]|uniref:type 1 glutamine amidotransferase n=1 Tax=Actinomyces vulturis TaxID=1857645 RepID=UPI0008317301|nr:glutamine amidotransferase [Actinomyces vulturis]